MVGRLMQGRSIERSCLTATFLGLLKRILSGKRAGNKLLPDILARHQIMDTLKLFNDLRRNRFMDPMVDEYEGNKRHHEQRGNCPYGPFTCIFPFYTPHE
jgi:hypothetical protein